MWLETLRVPVEAVWKPLLPPKKSQCSIRGAELLNFWSGDSLSLACPELCYWFAFSVCFYPEKWKGRHSCLPRATDEFSRERYFVPAMMKVRRASFPSKLRVSVRDFVVPVKFRLKAVRIIAQRQVRGNANGALGLMTNKIRPVRTKEKIREQTKKVILCFPCVPWFKKLRASRGSDRSVASPIRCKKLGIRIFSHP